MASALLTHLLEDAQIKEGLPEPSLGDYDLIQIDERAITGSDTKAR